MAQKGFFIDLSRCTGCRTCTIACADLKNTPIGLYNRTVNEYEGGGWKKTKTVSGLRKKFLPTIFHWDAINAQIRLA